MEKSSNDSKFKKQPEKWLLSYILPTFAMLLNNFKYVYTMFIVLSFRWQL